jgi:hypothetical protein
VALGQGAQLPEPRPRIFGALHRRRDGHQAFDAQVVELGHGLEGRGDLARGEAALARLARNIHLDQRLDDAPRGAGPPIACPGHLQPIDGVDDVEEFQRVLDLVGLEMSDEVPRHRSPQDGDLLFRLLHAVLPQGPDAPGHRLLDALDVDRLGHGDEENVLGAPPAPLGRARNPLAHALDVRPNVVHGG